MRRNQTSKKETLLCAKTTPYFDPEQLVVVKRRGTTIFAENERHSRKRNISHFEKVVRRKREQNESESDVELQAPENDNLKAQGNRQVRRNHDELPLRRSTRGQKHVQRYGTVIRSDSDLFD